MTQPFANFLNETVETANSDECPSEELTLRNNPFELHGDNELTLDLTVVGEMQLGFFGAISNMFDGGQTLNSKMIAYQQQIASVERTNKLKCSMYEAKLRAFVEVVNKWQDTQLAIAEGAITITGSKLTIQVPADIDRETLVDMIRVVNE